MLHIDCGVDIPSINLILLLNLPTAYFAPSIAGLHFPGSVSSIQISINLTLNAEHVTVISISPFSYSSSCQVPVRIFPDCLGCADKASLIVAFIK